LGMIIELDQTNEKRIKSALKHVKESKYMGIISLERDSQSLSSQIYQQLKQAGVFIAPDIYQSKQSQLTEFENSSLEYPFKNESDLIFEIQKSGLKTFDYTQVGIAHYGMLADHIQSIREHSDTSTYDSLMNSAEAYLKMWSRTKNK